MRLYTDKYEINYHFGQMGEGWGCPCIIIFHFSSCLLLIFHTDLHSFHLACFLNSIQYCMTFILHLKNSNRIHKVLLCSCIIVFDHTFRNAVNDLVVFKYQNGLIMMKIITYSALPLSSFNMETIFLTLYIMIKSCHVQYSTVQYSLVKL